MTYIFILVIFSRDPEFVFYSGAEYQMNAYRSVTIGKTQIVSK